MFTFHVWLTKWILTCEYSSCHPNCTGFVLNDIIQAFIEWINTVGSKFAYWAQVSSPSIETLVKESFHLIALNVLLWPKISCKETPYTLNSVTYRLRGANNGCPNYSKEDTTWNVVTVIVNPSQLIISCVPGTMEGNTCVYPCMTSGEKTFTATQAHHQTPLAGINGSQIMIKWSNRLSWRMFASLSSYCVVVPMPQLLFQEPPWILQLSSWLGTKKIALILSFVAYL